MKYFINILILLIVYIYSTGHVTDRMTSIKYVTSKVMSYLFVRQYTQTVLELQFTRSYTSIETVNDGRTLRTKHQITTYESVSGLITDHVCHCELYIAYLLIFVKKLLSFK